MDNADNALLLGSPSLHVCAGMSLLDEPRERGWECLRRSIVEILEYVRGTGLRVYIEPAHRFESNQILTIDDGLRMIREIGDPQLGILLDTGHLHVNGEDLAEGVGNWGRCWGTSTWTTTTARPIRTWRRERARSTSRRSRPPSNAPATQAMCRLSWACSTCSTLNRSSPPAWRGCGRRSPPDDDYPGAADET